MAATFQQLCSLPLQLGLLLLLLLLGHDIVQACPGACTCKWKAGKEWVECAGRGLQGLPQGAREETQVLDLSNNQLLSLEADCFFVLRLVNLQRLYLARSRLQRIASRAFIGLQGLVELDLSDNELEQVPSETFASIANLMRLSLAGNPLGEVRRGAFRHLGQLTFLELSRCKLRIVEEEAFVGLHALEWLRLNDNLMSSLSQEALPAPRAPLHGLPLHENPWRCDCRLQGLRSWLEISQAQAPQEAEPGCVEPPRLKGRRLRSLKLQELACAPQLELHQPAKLDLIKGENMSLSCVVRANPRPTTLWLFNGKPLSLSSVTAFTVTSDLLATTNRYIYSEEVTEDKIIISLDIVGVEMLDEGNYVCQAENAAGIASKNYTIHVISHEQASANPPLESDGNIERSASNSTGYAAVIAAGALIGTLLALGCLFLGIFFYARRLRSVRLKATVELKQVPGSESRSATNCDPVTGLSNNFVPASILKKPCRPTEACFRELPSHAQSELAENYPQHGFLEPDLINEVPSEPATCDYRQLHQLHQLPNNSNCLDRDGYPLNFGLPKLDCLSRDRPGCVSLPRLRHRQQQVLLQDTQQHINSPALPQQRYAREAEFLAGYQQPASFYELGYAAVVQTIPLPPPPAYRGQPPADLSLLQEQSPSRSPERAIQHPESPDEGYVGDALDV